ncbi:MAG: hypothetical protein U5K72_02160 [Balneolaceae bacterium]|nr:hypothetical protein [Balneolaceae bacterium]
MMPQKEQVFNKMAAQVCGDFSGIEKTVRKKLISGEFGLITIDGRDGSGKSTLAISLANALDAEHLEIDQYVNENKDGYSKHIRFNDLYKDYESSCRDYSIVILEGICIMNIISKIGVEPDISIYIKRIKDNFWFDGLMLFNPDKDADQHIADRRLSDNSLQSEIIRYHYRYMPHETSDIVFERFI